MGHSWAALMRGIDGIDPDLRRCFQRARRHALAALKVQWHGDLGDDGRAVLAEDLAQIRQVLAGFEAQS